MSEAPTVRAMAMEERGRDLRHAVMLRDAALILERRTKHPKGLLLTVFVKVIRSVAKDIEAGKLPVLR